MKTEMIRVRVPEGTIARWTITAHDAGWQDLSKAIRYHLGIVFNDSLEPSAVQTAGNGEGERTGDSSDEEGNEVAPLIALPAHPEGGEAVAPSPPSGLCPRFMFHVKGSYCKTCEQTP